MHDAKKTIGFDLKGKIIYSHRKNDILVITRYFKSILKSIQIVNEVKEFDY